MTPLTKMGHFGHSTHTIFRYFSAIFLDSTGEIFLTNSAGPFTELRSGWLCYFCYLAESGHATAVPDWRKT